MSNKKEQINLSSFSNFTEIGRGAFGVVYKAIYNVNNKVYAIKKISKRKIKQQKMDQQVGKEINISRQLKHPHIIYLYNYINEPDSVSLILELAQNGQLYTRLMQKGRLDEQFAKKIISQTISALKYLHGLPEPIIHRDIKPQNILLDKNDDVKLADFGWSNYSNQKRTTYCGTHEYLAPQMIDPKNDKGHDEKLDIWCLGVLTYQILAGHPPFTPEPSHNSFNEDRNKLYQNILNVKITFPSDFPAVAKDFVMKILKRNPNERATLAQLEEHPWLKSQPISKITRMNTTSPTRKQQINMQEQSRDKAIIQDLNKKNQQLQKQLHSLKIKEGMRKQQPVIVQKNPNLEADNKRIKAMEEITQKYKREVQSLHAEMVSKDKQIMKLKSQLRAASEIKQDSQQYKSERDTLQQKYKNLQKMHEQLTQKYLDITTTLENQRLELNLKLKEARRNGGNAQSSESIGIIGDLQQAMVDLSKKFSESKKLIAQVSRKQTNVSNLQKEVQKLRFQQNTIKQEVQAEMKEYYQNKMDEIMLKAREELTKEKEKWQRQHQQLIKENEPEHSTEYSSNNVSGTRELEIDQELKKTRELNQLLERRIKEQEYKIKDLEDAARRKK